VEEPTVEDDVEGLTELVDAQGILDQEVGLQAALLGLVARLRDGGWGEIDPGRW
jgi:hypothetical protein